MKFPLIGFKNNIVFNEKGEVFALYRLKSKPYNHKPEMEKKQVLRSFEQLLWGLEGKGKIHFLSEKLYIDEDQYLNKANVVFSDEAYRHARDVRRTYAAGARKRRRYLEVQLNANIFDNDWKAVFEEFRDMIVGLFLGSERWVLNEQRIQQALDAEETMYKRIAHAVEPFDFSDLDFIIRKTTNRIGILPPPLASRDGGLFTPAILSAFSEGCTIDESGGTYVKVTNGADETHYQSFITFPDLPKVLPEIGAEWLASLDAIEIPVDAVINFNITKSHKAHSKASDRRKYLKGQIKEAEKGGEEPSDDEEYAYQEGRKLESKLRAGQPLASISTILCIADRDLKSLKANVKKIMDRYTTSGYRAVRPIGDQKKCLYSFIPGSIPAAPSIEVDPGYVAASGPTISLEIGDDKGLFLGWSGASPVLWQPGYAAKVLNRSNAVLMSGALGGGKSLTIKYLLYLAYLTGAYMFIIDPKKNEYAVLEKLFPIKKVDLCPGGKSQLNPFMLSKNPLQAKTVVIDYLAIVLNLREDDDNRRIAITNAVEEVMAMQHDKRNLYSCLDVFKKIAKNHPDISIRQEANKCALLLEGIKNSSLGYLVFGTGGYDDIARVTVVNMQGLPLPRTAERLSSGRISDSERQGLGLLYLAATMAREIAFSLPAEVIKAEVFDEAWMLLNISEGRRVVDEIIRMAARSYGTIPILATQNTTDINDLQTLKNNINYFFCFRAQDRTEIETNLNLIGAGKSDNSLAELFPKLESGECIMRDALGRIGQVYIDPCPGYLLNLFDTSPKEEEQNAV